MKLIILRGVPGCGKTTIAEVLLKKLNATYMNIDKFKFMPNSGDRYRRRAFAYKKTIEELDKIKKNSGYVIVDEVFDNKEFVENIIKFTRENNIKYNSFYITRRLEELVKTEETRNRHVKNDVNNFIELAKAIESVEIENELIIKNININESVKLIIKKLSSN